jgi:hypothetical protein
MLLNVRLTERLCCPSSLPRSCNGALLLRYRRLAANLRQVWVIHADALINSGLDQLTDVGDAGRHVSKVPTTDIRGRPSARPRIRLRFSFLSTLARHSRAKESVPSTVRRAIPNRAGTHRRTIAGIAVVAKRARFRRARAALGGRLQSTSLEPRPATLRLHHRPRLQQCVCGHHDRSPTQ